MDRCSVSSECAGEASDAVCVKWHEGLQYRQPTAKNVMFDSPIQQGAGEPRVTHVQFGQISAQDLRVPVVFGGERELRDEQVPELFRHWSGPGKATAK